ncbi:hypothetical protein [Oceaniradius stylonematis]|uniref:hypothetical protein n=1 Tax=Oceaniradius stylonematis TaxID=2184161 RepID=UPI00273FAAEF|nr:hypothetical protein [Oceaniradius stylonematis]
MSNEESSDYIAGSLTANDWKARKIKLLENGDEADWASAFDDFLMARLKHRYLTPIKMLQDDGSFQGEGFTIVSVQCALIEFLAALKIGKNYKLLKRGEKIGPYEYTRSNALFRDFLAQEKPFSECFPSISDSQEFYKNVRCALLHEARTKNGWRIWAAGDIAVDVHKKIVRRDALQVAINAYLDSYGLLLTRNKSVQEAFVRKFDHLADL